MAQDGDKADKLEFTPEGETLGYISLDQARVIALQHARDDREFYGRYADAELVWDVIGAEETEDYYEVRLAYRPAGNFRAAAVNGSLLSPGNTTGVGAQWKATSFRKPWTTPRNVIMGSTSSWMEMSGR